MSLQSDPSEIAIVLITYYPKWYKGVIKSIKHTDKVRGDLCLEFLTMATKAGYHVVLVDGKSAKTFRQELQSFSTIHLINRRTKKRSPNKRLGINVASQLPGVKVIVLTEPEKTSLLRYMAEITEPILKGQADIVVPKREEKSFKSSYPKYMYESESEGIRIYNEALLAHGLLRPHMSDLDSFFGPRAILNEKKIIALFLRKYTFRTSKYQLKSNLFDPDEYSNVQGFPIIQALKKQLKIVSVEIPFVYPRLQKENEDATAKEAFFEKRKLQRLSLLVDLFHFLSLLDRKKYSRLKAVNS